METNASRILCVYGNPKAGGFVHGCVDHVAARLEARGMEVDRLVLNDLDMGECRGCFTCLRTGRCVVEDDVAEAIERIRHADGLVVGASVRNGYFPALYKKFYERITYIVGFGRELRGKPTLAIGAVGLAGGRGPLGRLATFREFRTLVVDFLFFRTGIPTKKTPESVAPRLDRAADDLARAIETREGLSLWTRFQDAIDVAVVRRFMLKRDPETYRYVVDRWKEEGLM